jgi:tRNA A37 threonylcarbamoyladenosine dehydratase
MSVGPELARPPAEMEAGRRFGALERLYGVSGAQRIRAAHVVVVGLGGVGSWAAESLARSNVGCLTLVDLDHVSESNINRQVQADDASLGQAKVLAMRNRIRQFNGHCEVRCVEEFVDARNWPNLLGGVPDAVIDACDELAAKVTLAGWARSCGVSFISAGAAGGKRLAHLVEIDDLSKVTHDPLLAQLRSRLRRAHGAPGEGRSMGLACVFSREAVVPADPSCAMQDDGSLNCHGYGSVVAVTATFGQCAAGWILDELSRVPL